MGRNPEFSSKPLGFDGVGTVLSPVAGWGSDRAHPIEATSEFRLGRLRSWGPLGKHVFRYGGASMGLLRPPCGGDCGLIDFRSFR